MKFDNKNPHESVTVYQGNVLEVLPQLEDASVDSIVTDPPYELKFMGRKWDASGISYNVDLWRECYRVLKRLVTPPQGTVLDPFVGSGTTLEAALLEGFHSIGIDNCPEYIPLIQARIDRSGS